MIETLNRFAAYDGWANAEALQSLRAIDHPLAKAVQLLAHIVSAQWLWLERMEGRPQSYSVWPEWSLAEIEAQSTAANQAWRKFLAGKDDAALRRTFSYTNTKGQPFTSSIGDVCLHLAMHGTYHRGQIALLVRQHGGDPAYTDFIQAARTGKL